MADLEQLVQSVVKNSYPKERNWRSLIPREAGGVVVKNERDHLVLRYWTALFEYHQGILTLLRNENPTSAAALLRVFEEAYAKLFLVMYGTDKEFRAISDGKYSTDFAAVGARIDEKLGAEPLYGPRFKRRVGTLHGLTHSGPEQMRMLVSRSADGGLDIAPNYSDDDICKLAQETMPTVFFAAVFTTAFLDFAAENQTAKEMFDDYVETQVKLIELQEMAANVPAVE